MLPLNLLLVLATTTFAAAAPLPNPKADITVSHTSASTGESSSAVIDPSWFSSKFAKVMTGLGADLNIHLTGAKRSHAPRHSLLKRFIATLAPRDSRLAAPVASASGIKNSTINLTVISKRRAHVLARRAEGNSRRAVAAAAAAAAAHHNVLIDASSTVPGSGGGIHDSVINVHLNSRSPSIVAGAHSVVVNPSAGGIDASTVHVNILPARASVGDHSIVIDSSSGSSGDTQAGDHSAVVSSHINDSTINLTVVKAKDALSPALERRSEGESQDDQAWDHQVKAMTFPMNDDDFPVPPPNRPAAVWVPGSGSHASRVARSA